PGQESVWDYPRPPAVVPFDGRVRVVHRGVTVADTTRAQRVLETSHPPTYYLPVDCFAAGVLRPAASRRRTTCEFKGVAGYHDLVLDDLGVSVADAGWSYPDPRPGFERLAGAVALYPGRVDRVTVDGEAVRAQEGDFYGGWITSRVAGPFKGGPGTRGW
ncbi:MAG TPA: DUF427 domain-containing protein, partial [Jiangellales bacterium]|nr:DUF427 domain-containing protein [Jiangellales bacterium]